MIIAIRKKQTTMENICNIFGIIFGICGIIRMMGYFLVFIAFQFELGVELFQFKSERIPKSIGVTRYSENIRRNVIWVRN